jgi:hypothetical protein
MKSVELESAAPPKPRLKRIEKQWLTYRHVVLPKDAPPIQISECRRAFYAGAEGLLSEILETTADGAQCLCNELTRQKEHDLAGGLKRKRQMARREARRIP